MSKLENPELPTGLVYHPDMLRHTISLEDEALSSLHPEHPGRLKAIVSRFEKNGILPRLDIVKDFEECSPDLVSAVHPEPYFDYIEGIWENGNKDENQIICKNAGTYCCKDSARAAKLAVASMAICVDKLFTGQWKNCFAAVRPPGHHAGMNNDIAGFCFFNNVAAAARYAQKNHGIKRVAIFDWDAHHGNTTQDIFYEDDSVLFISTHRYDKGNFYPQKTGPVEKLGKGRGEGFNLNLPWNTRADEDFKVCHAH